MIDCNQTLKVSFNTYMKSARCAQIKNIVTFKEIHNFGFHAKIVFISNISVALPIN